MATPLPHHYEVSLHWPGAGAARVAGGIRPIIETGAPPEFDGQPGWWSPEHLLLASLATCLQATFEGMARRERVRVESYETRALATLDRAREGPVFTYLGLNVTVTAAPADVARVRDLVTRAKQHCIVGRALMPPVHLTLMVRAVTPVEVPFAS
jgi:organic hydroperoxide reductase OsmC/OhrA